MDNFSGTTVTKVLVPAAKTSTYTSSAIDTQTFEGDWAFIVNSAAGTGTTPTLIVKAQSSTTSGGQYADISGAVATTIDDTAGGATYIVRVDKKAHDRYVKLVGTIAGTCPSFTFGLSIVSKAKYL